MINIKKETIRMCGICRERKTKENLLKLVRSKEMLVTEDKTGKLPGRGAYICYSEKCLDIAVKSKRIEKSFGAKISDEIYENLRGVIIEQGENT